MKVATTSSNIVTRFEAYQTAVSMSPIGRDVRRNFLALQTANLLWGNDPVAQAELVATLKPYFVQEVVLAQTALRETLARSPNDLRGYLYLIKLLHAYGRLYDTQALDQARLVLNEARERNPNQVLFLWVDVALRLQQGDLDTARVIAQEASALAPDHTTTIENQRLLETYLGQTGSSNFDQLDLHACYFNSM